MTIARRPWLLALLACLPAARGAHAAPPPAPTHPDLPRRGRPLVFPRDHGAHPGARTEWWYATGWLQAEGARGDTPAFGFQVTFFRSRTGLAADLPGRLAPRQLLFAHAALTDLAASRHRHAQRLARWDGRSEGGAVAASLTDTAVSLGRWQIARAAAGGAYDTRVDDANAGFGLALQLQPTQPLLLQGEAGWSRKGPDVADASHYYSLPQLAVSGRLRLAGREQAVQGRAWLDHEWSEQALPAQAQGWDWIGMNLADGSALTAFRLRRPDGTALWAGGSHRSAEGRLTIFAADDVRFEPLATWTSRDSGARYPVRWRLHTPVGLFEVRSLLDAQELDSRGSTGAVYWEGVSELLDGGGRRVGLGYLEMTGYASRLRL